MGFPVLAINDPKAAAHGASDAGTRFESCVDIRDTNPDAVRWNAPRRLGDYDTFYVNLTTVVARHERGAADR